MAKGFVIILMVVAVSLGLVFAAGCESDAPPPVGSMASVTDMLGTGFPCASRAVTTTLPCLRATVLAFVV